MNFVTCKDNHDNTANVNVYWVYQNLANPSVYEACDVVMQSKFVIANWAY